MHGSAQVNAQIREGEARTTQPGDSCSSKVGGNENSAFQQGHESPLLAHGSSSVRKDVQLAQPGDGVGVQLRLNHTLHSDD